MRNSILKYFITTLFFSSFTNFVNANPAFSTNTIPCISKATELVPENTYEDRVKGVFTPSCVETRNTTEATLTTLKQIVEKPDGYKLILKEIDKVLSNWAGETFCTDRTCAYNQGRLIFDVVSLFYGVGEAKALLKTGVAGNKVAKMMVEMDKTAIAIATAIRSSAVKAQKVAIGFQLAVQLNTGVFFNIGKLEAATKTIRFNVAPLVASALPNAEVITRLDNVAYFVQENGASVVKHGSVDVVDNGATALVRVGNVGNLGTMIDNVITVIAKNENLPNWIKESFKNSKYLTAKTTNKVTLYRDFGDQAFMDGSFSTTINNATRNELALHPSFNNNMRFKSTIEVPTGETLNLGKVGPYPPGSPSAFPGGADQILLPENYSHTWIKKIVDTQTGQVYTVGQFKQAFPNLIKNP